MAVAAAAESKAIEHGGNAIRLTLTTGRDRAVREQPAVPPSTTCDGERTTLRQGCHGRDRDRAGPDRDRDRGCDRGLDRSRVRAPGHRGFGLDRGRAPAPDRALGPVLSVAPAPAPVLSRIHVRVPARVPVPFLVRVRVRARARVRVRVHARVHAHALAPYHGLGLGRGRGLLDPDRGLVLWTVPCPGTGWKWLGRRVAGACATAALRGCWCCGLKEPACRCRRHVSCCH